MAFQVHNYIFSLGICCTELLGNRLVAEGHARLFHSSAGILLSMLKSQVAQSQHVLFYHCPHSRALWWT